MINVVNNMIRYVREVVFFKFNVFSKTLFIKDLILFQDYGTKHS